MATILDTFTIAFNSEGLKQFEAELQNNEKSLAHYEKEVEKLEKKLEELGTSQKDNFEEVVKVSKELDEARNKVKLFGDSVKTMKGQSEYQLLQLKKNFANLTKTLGMLAFVGVAIKKSLDFYEQGEQLQFLADKTGIAVEKLQQLGNAAKKYGGTTEGSAGTVENLRQQYQDARMGNVSGGLRDAQLKYGFTISSDPEETLQRVAKRMETLKSDVQKWDLAKSLGIDEGTTRLLIQGQAKYNEELKKASRYKLYTKEDLQRMREYRQISGDIRMGIESIFGTLWRSLLPAITTVGKEIKKVTDWMAEHEGATKLIATMLAVTTAIFAVKGAVGLLNKETLKLLANPVAWTIIGIGVAITGIIAIIQDFITFLQGGESVYGEMLKKVGYDVEAVRNAWLKFFEGIKNYYTWAFDVMKSFGGKIAEFANQIKALWDSIPDPIKKLIGMSNTVTGAFTSISTGKEIIQKYNDNKLNSVPAGSVQNFASTQSINENNSNNSRNTNNTNNRNINVNEVKIEVTSNNPVEAGQEIQNALNNIDNGLKV